VSDKSSDMLQLYRFLSVVRKKQILAIIMLSFIAAFAEIASIGALLPFIGVITNPDMVMSNETIVVILHFVGVTTASEMIPFFAVAFSLIVIASGLIRYTLLWLQTKFSFAIGGDLVRNIYEKKLYQDYELHVLDNTSDVMSAITIKVRDVVNQIVGPCITLISSALLLLSIATFLIILDPLIALMAFGLFGTMYLVIAMLVKKKLVKHGRIMTDNQNLIVKAVQEGLGGIRDVILDSVQSMYLKRFTDYDLRARASTVDIVVISQAPKFVVESIGLVLIAIVAYVLIVIMGREGDVIATLGALGLGAQRMLPILQQTYWSHSQIAGGGKSLTDVVNLLADETSEPLGYEKLLFNDRLTLSEISYTYSGARTPILDKISIDIHKGSKIGIVGETGSGKSTLVDLIMGLLLPTSGSINVDGVEIVKSINLGTWRHLVSHVPQDIFLTDDTVLANIAFGVPEEHIDRDRARKVAKISQLCSVIEHLPNKYNSMVGERGSTLSGGQKQRLGIARALYKKSDVIIFDEATSALDARTEEKIIDAISSFDSSITIFMIAHRTNTLKLCSSIWQVRNGGVKISRYKDLVVESPVN
jgi:ATP-binding cassette, subfamily B, bacterial PglK